jgi:hypothetical protein
MTENPLHTTPVPAVLEAGRDDDYGGRSSGGIDGEKNRQKERKAWVRERESLQGELQSERREREELQRRYDELARSMEGGQGGANADSASSTGHEKEEEGDTQEETMAP